MDFDLVIQAFHGVPKLLKSDLSSFLNVKGMELCQMTWEWVTVIAIWVPWNVLTLKWQPPLFCLKKYPTYSAATPDLHTKHQIVYDWTVNHSLWSVSALGISIIFFFRNNCLFKTWCLMLQKDQYLFISKCEQRWFTVIQKYSVYILFSTNMWSWKYIFVILAWAENIMC